MESKAIKRAVAYTDGSAMNYGPRKGENGWGVHGYIYDDTGMDVKTSNRPKKYNITNEGYLLNDQLLKIPHLQVSPIFYFDWCGYEDKDGTNNTAEVTAIIRAIEGLVEQGVSEIFIKSDSEYALNMLEKILDENTDNNTLVNNTDTNRAYLLAMWNAVETAKENDVVIRYGHVYGHNTSYGNHRADLLALLGRMRHYQKIDKINDMKIRPPKNYWTSKIQRPPYLNFKQIFFFDHTFINPDGSAMYSIMNYKKETEIGKKDPEVSYVLLYLPKADPFILELCEVYKDIIDDLESTSTVRLDNLYSSDTLSLYESFGKDVYLPGNKKRREVTILEEEVLMNEIMPQGRATIASDNTTTLMRIYEHYVNVGKSENFYTYIDITNEFYTKNDKDKVIIKPEFTQQERIKKIDFKHPEFVDVQIPLLPNSDIPHRNMFKQLEKYEPKVTLIVINNNYVKLDYFTVLELNNGVIMVYSNFYAKSVYILKKHRK